MKRRYQRRDYAFTERRHGDQVTVDVVNGCLLIQVGMRLNKTDEEWMWNSIRLPPRESIKLLGRIKRRLV